MSLPAAIEAREVAKIFVSEGRAVYAIENASFSVPRGAFVSLIGPSGCGKSTLLRMIGGLDEPSGGEIKFDGRPIQGINTRVGYVPQHDHLLPWRSAGRNVALSLEFRGASRGDIDRRVADLLRLVGLSAFAESYPAQLSGGMRKRVSLVRAFASNPECLLMDEPFGALDAQTRGVMQRELLRIWEGNSQTIVFVTHDIEEAILLSDFVVVLSKPPARVKMIRHVALSRPRDLKRDRFSPEFRELYSVLLESIEQDGAEGVQA
jgi:NitT/TauT family transport system ATP-binding protein